ncbi:MAG: hypothetical protein ACKO1N_01330 [Erythrobacter sp.]
MKASYWLVCGFLTLGCGRMMGAMGDQGTSPEARLPLYIFALMIMIGAAFCFYKAMKTFVSGPSSSKASAPVSPRPARRMADEPGVAATSDFDADEAFARYMANRTSAPVESAADTVAPQQPTPPRPGFGRKVV